MTAAAAAAADDDDDDDDDDNDDVYPKPNVITIIFLVPVLMYEF